jgi:LAO/AO transport system kinase
MTSRYDAKALADGIRARQRLALAKAITLIESQLPGDRVEADRLLLELMPMPTKTLRLGISGVPGVGKSTFIERIGPKLIPHFGSLGILTVDPTSPVHGGSILGDKTRMGNLANDERCFIRPSPAGASLGGIAAHTRETIVLLEAFGFGAILVETVGVGQSEHLVSSMVDCFIVLQLPGAGDELQGVKRGILELCDILIVNKVDGDNIRSAAMTQTAHLQALNLLNRRMPVLPCSSTEGTGFDEIVQAIVDWHESGLKSGHLVERRRRQLQRWFEDSAEERYRERILAVPELAALRKELGEKVMEGVLPVNLAVTQWVDEIDRYLREDRRDCRNVKRPAT